MKKKIIYLIFTVALVAVVVALSSAVQLVYAKYAAESDAEQGVSFNYEAHKGSTDYILKMIDGNASQHIKHWNCCDTDVYENHTFNSNFTCACGYINHVHSYSKVENLSKAATCTVSGYDYMQCSCGDNYTTAIEALGHEYNSQTISDTYLCSAGTCQVEATYYYKCTRCTEKDTTRTFKGAKANHVYSTTTQKYLNTSATCQAAATYFYECKWCGAKGSNTYSSGSTVAHAYNTQTVNSTYLCSSATCQAAASYYYKCQWCSAKGTNTYTSGGVASHKYETQSVSSTYLSSNATCLVKAKYYYKCNWCTAKGSNTYEYGNTLAHVAGTQLYQDSNGHFYRCINGCNGEMSRSSHSGSYQSDGSQHWKNCSTCNYQMVGKTNHSGSYSSNSSKHWKNCSTCNYTMVAEASHAGSFEYNGTQHWKKCSTCSYAMVSTATHTTTHAKAYQENGAVKCSACSYSVTPSVFYDGMEIYLQNGVTYVGEWSSEYPRWGNDDLRGSWTAFVSVAKGGNYIQVASQKKRYMVIEYNGACADIFDTANLKIDPVQYHIGVANNTVDGEFAMKRITDVTMQDKSLLTERFDFGSGATSSDYITLYLWVTKAITNISNISMFDSEADAIAYQEMLSCCQDYIIYNCGKATTNRTDDMCVTNYSGTKSIRSVANAHGDISGLAYPTSGQAVACMSVEAEGQSYMAESFLPYRRARKKE